MARTSLVTVGVMALGDAGCLLTDKPEFAPPGALQPFLTNLNPPASKILVIPRKPGTGPDDNIYMQEKTISFDIRSEDLGKELFAAVFIDLHGRIRGHVQTSLDSFTAGVGTLTTPRAQTRALPIPLSTERGCHPITVLVSHQTSIFTGQTQGDVGLATWWAQIGVDESDPQYEACEPDPVPGDAGADARAEGGTP